MMSNVINIKSVKKKDEELTPEVAQGIVETFIAEVADNIDIISEALDSIETHQMSGAVAMHLLIEEACKRLEGCTREQIEQGADYYRRGLEVTQTH
tara:strand:+ start:3753 stop:4040 length:288 start_codon:yes stop_codon:yes gene_type:complete